MQSQKKVLKSPHISFFAKGMRMFQAHVKCSVYNKSGYKVDATALVFKILK